MLGLRRLENVCGRLISTVDSQPLARAHIQTPTAKHDLLEITSVSESLRVPQACVCLRLKVGAGKGRVWLAKSLAGNVENQSLAVVISTQACLS